MCRKSSIYGEKKSCPRSAKHEPNAALAGSFRSRFDSINPRGRVVKQRRALSGGIFFCDQLKCVPESSIAIRKFFHRKIAFEHAASGAEFFNTPLEVRFHSLRELFR